jgi:nitrogen-specific signal transduction histidine kinase
MDFLTSITSRIKRYIKEDKKVKPEVFESIKYNSRVLSEKSVKNESSKTSSTIIDTNDITTFIRCLFHDFRGSLNNIFLGIDLLSQSIENNDENRELLKNINESCKFLNDTVDGFLNIQKIKHNTKLSEIEELRYEPFSIVGLVKNLQYILMFNILDKKIKIIYDIKKVEEWVIGDKNHLQHVLMNLLMNAIKYSDKNTDIKICLDCINITENNKTYIIQVEDNNQPISQYIKAKLFTKYNTSDTTTGTGLGLYICKQIITRHGGTIDHTYNVTGTGNIFTICLILKVCNTSTNFPLHMSSSKLKSTKNTQSEGNLNDISSENVELPQYIDISNAELITNRKIEKSEENKSSIRNFGSSKRQSSLSIFSNSQSKSSIKHCMVIDDSEISRKFMIKLLTNTCKNMKLYEAVDGLDALVKLVKIGETMQPIDMIFVIHYAKFNRRIFD